LGILIGVAVVVGAAIIGYAIYQALKSPAAGGESSGETDPLLGATKEAHQQDNAPVSGENAKSCTPAPAPQVTHAKLQIMQIEFEGSYLMNKDTEGPFPSPDWELGRLEQAPISYRRDQQANMIVRFSVTQAPSTSESVEIKAEAAFGIKRIQWTATVTVDPGDTEVDVPTVIAGDKLPNHVACYDRLVMKWEINPAGSGWQSAGNSEHQFYLLLDTPTGVELYWTLVDISCRAAQGATTEIDLVSRSYGPVRTRSLKRKRDGHALTYWNPDTTTATSTELLLATVDGSGQCGSWSEFLIDMWKVHGIATADKILVIKYGASASPATIGFLVKNWAFGPTGSHPAPYTHAMRTECTKEPGVPGQRNPNPPPAFFNHFIVRHGGKYYDPSYGSAPVSTQAQWESGSIDGLFQNGSPLTCGYPKASNPGLLLEFWDLTTNTKI